MEALINKVVEFKEHPNYTESPFSHDGVYFHVSPRFFTVLPMLPTAAREALKFISLNVKNGQVFMPVSSLLIYSKVKSQALVEAGIESLLEHKLIARSEGDTYWVDLFTS